MSGSNCSTYPTTRGNHEGTAWPSRVTEPSTWALPRSGQRCMRALRRVVFPEPLGPIRPTRKPELRSADTRWRMVRRRPGWALRPVIGSLDSSSSSLPVALVEDS
eukprot:scaffold665624_cov39-Prasinocladus_malaysianus.AAC.1